MEEQQLPQLELLCQQLYEATDSQLRTQAEKALVQFSDSPNSFRQCQFVLERSRNPYALLLAASTLTKLITKANCTISIQDRLQLRNYVLQFLGSRLGLVNYITQALVQLIARMTKHGWLDGDKKVFVFRDILDEVGKFLRGSVDHCVVGVQILYHLVMEMNLPDTMRSVSKHRKVASSFRDESLLDIFTLSCTLLQQINVHDKTQHDLMSWLLKLACACLSFNFIGTATDESGDDLTTVQIPSTWRNIFMDFNTLHLFINLFHSMSAHEISAMSISCVVQMASIRRSLFSSNERINFLAQIIKGVNGILEQPQTLANPECYHEFCRLLLRIKSNYQLGELLRLDDYSKFIELIAKFTVSSLQSWQFSANSIHYLLGFWQKLVGSIPYIKSNETHLLDKYIPEITKVYVTSRLESVEVVLRDQLENPLDDQTLVMQQLDQMSVIGRCEFDSTCVLLVNLFDQTAASYQKLLQGSQTGDELALREGQLTWLIYLIGSVIGGRVDRYYSSDSDAIDGQLISRGLQLMELTDPHLPQHGSEYLYQAFIYFFEHFKMVYIDDSVNKNSKIYDALSENLGLTNESMVLNVYITKIVTFLKYWSSNKLIVRKTLQLLYELSVGYTSARKLLKLDSIQFILENHTPEHFPFLNLSLELKCHTIFYRALGRLLLIDLGEDEDKFERFISPLTVIGDRITNAFMSQTTSDQVELKRLVIALCRDLRGLAFSFCSRTCYMMLFEWIYPKYTGILLKALDIWYYDQEVTTPILKLMAEIVQNKSQRVQFDVTSPNGILLFREASKIITCYGDHILTISDIPDDKLYDLKLKGVSVSFKMLKEALCGGYVNFGVFKLYGDNALDKALNMFVKLLVSIPLKTLLEYPKLSKAYYGMLEVLSQDHMEFICSLEPDVFVYILSSILEGLTGLDSVVCTGCCGTLDHIVTFFFKNLSKTKRKDSVVAISPSQQTTFLHLLELHSDLFQQMLSTVMNTIMFDKCRNQWSMSRPLLGLILLNEDYFRTWRQRVVNMQPVEKQPMMLSCLDNLMDSIERNLQSRNRDNFTKNLSLFCRDIYNSMKDMVSDVPDVLITTANAEMMS